MRDSRVLYDTAHPDVALATELNALATVYRRAVERYEEAHVKEEEGGPETAPENARKESDELSRNTDSTR